MSRGPGISEDDEIWLLVLGAIGLLAIMTNIDPIWSVASAWLVDRQLLSTSDFLLPLPGGVGFDVQQLALLCAALIFLLIVVRITSRRLAAAKIRRMLDAAHRGQR